MGVASMCGPAVVSAQRAYTLWSSTHFSKPLAVNAVGQPSRNCEPHAGNPNPPGRRHLIHGGSVVTVWGHTPTVCDKSDQIALKRDV